MGANMSTMFFLNKNREGILGIGKKKKKKKKDDDTTAAAPAPSTTVCPDPPAPLQYPNPTAPDQARVYNSQLSTYSNTITNCNGKVSDLSSELAQCRVDLENEKKDCKLELKNQKTKYEVELTEQEKKYLAELDIQKKKYDKIIAGLEKKLKDALNTIKKDNITIEDDNTTITYLKAELNAAKISRDKCIQEALRAGRRFGYPKANAEANIYTSEIDGLFSDINQDMNTMEKQNVYAYTVKDHTQKINRELDIVNKQIELYNDKIHLNERKSFYEQQEINLEQGWEIGLHMLYASMFLGIIVFLCITKDNATNTPKIMNPKNIIIIIFLLLYPMLIYPITKHVYDLTKYSINQLPKNMYLSV